MVDKVWISSQVAEAFLKLQSGLGGNVPLVFVKTDGVGVGEAWLHKPTLYPAINIPAGGDGDWGAVARGVAHLISSLEGVPELRMYGPATDEGIARDINGEIQQIAGAKANIQPKPRWKNADLSSIVNDIVNPRSDMRPELSKFQLIRLLRLELDGHPAAAGALLKVKKNKEAELASAQDVFGEMISEKIDTPLGKAAASLKFIEYLGFSFDRFYFETSGASVSRAHPRVRYPGRRGYRHHRRFAGSSAKHQAGLVYVVAACEIIPI